MERIDEIRKHEPRVGTRKLKDRLEKMGLHVGRDNLFSLLRRRGKLVKVKKRGTKTTYSRHSYAVAPNVLKSKHRVSDVVFDLAEREESF
jgi:putative transposase